MVLMSLFSCACGSRGPRLLPCFPLLVSTSCAVNQGWVAKVPANPYVKKSLRRKLSIPCIKKKEKKKTYTDMPIFFYWHIVFLCPLVFRNMWSVHTRTYVSFAFLCNGSICLLRAAMFQWHYQCKCGDLEWQWLFLTAFPELWETACSVHMRLLIKGIFLPVVCGICSIPVETLLAGFLC